MDKQPSDGILEEFRIEFLDCWHKLPNKAFFFLLAFAWLALFHFAGSSTLGYIRTPSLFLWMYDGLTSGELLNSDEAYRVLVPFGVLVLFWLKRRELLALKLDLWWPGLLLLGLGVVVHLLGYLVQQPRMSVIGLFTGLYGLTGLAWGREWLRRSFFPFFLFAFCVPLGSVVIPITFRLRLLVSQLVELVSNYVLQIDVVREGTQILDPGGHFKYEVAAACSGIRSLMATIALAVILAFFSCGKWWKRLLMIASAFPLAVFGNLLRMLAIVIAADIGGQELGNKVHDGGPLDIWSLLPYVPAFIGLLMLEHYLADRAALPQTPGLEPEPV
ncbi:MAG TPA: exosortase/archaeosortase family protein [Candidatus Binatia bacterium]|jgi:exosortase|nr:exosortase/archaeosortase family protein [Candidatus Binatia bacterium]